MGEHEGDSHNKTIVQNGQEVGGSRCYGPNESSAVFCMRHGVVVMKKRAPFGALDGHSLT